MTKEEAKNCCSKKDWKGNTSAGGGAVYGLGIIGALFYFLPHANSFEKVIMGILKSLVWPALFVYHIFNLFKL
jgi:hypothetical protein